MIKGVNLIGQGNLIVVEPSAIDGKEYVRVKHPAQGIAPAPAWLLVDLRRGRCVPGHRSGRRARTARNTSTWPQTARQPLSGPRRPLRTATAPEIGLLAKATARFPVPGPGFRHNQLIQSFWLPWHVSWGIGSRRYTHSLSEFIAVYVGETLWASAAQMSRPMVT